MVEMNFGRARPEAILDLTRVRELTEHGPDDGVLRVGAGVTYTRAIAELGDRLPGLAIASRTVGSPQIRNRGTIGGNLGSSSPAGDALPPLYASGARVELASTRGTRSVEIEDFVTGPKQNVLEPDELIAAFTVAPAEGGQQFSKIGTRNAMVIAVCSFAIALDDEQRGRSGRASARPRRRPAARARPRTSSRGRLDWENRTAIDEDALGRFGELVARRGVPDRRPARQRRLPPSRARRHGTANAEVGVGMRLTCTINGEPREVDGLWEGESLLHVLRERLGLPGSKNACEQGECGSCSVYLDGELVCACLVLAGQAEGREIVTVEGLAPSEDELHPIQEAFLEAGAVQCGFCTPGLIVATHDLLARNAVPHRPRDPRGAGREPVPLHGLREDPRRRPPRRRPMTPERLIIEHCAIATVDAAGTEYAEGHIVIADGRIEAVGEGSAHRRWTPDRRQRLPRHARASSTATTTSTSGPPAASRSRRRCSSGCRSSTRPGPASTPTSSAPPPAPASPRSCAPAAARAPTTTTSSRSDAKRPARGRDRGGERAARALPPLPRLDGPRPLPGRPAARRGDRGPRRDPHRLRRGDRPLPRPGPRRDGPRRARSVLAVQRHQGADGRDRDLRPRAGRPPPHPHGRDARRGGVLPRAVRRPPRRVPGGAGLARRRRVARPLRAPRRARGPPLRRDRHRRRPLPVLQRPARRGHRARRRAHGGRRAGRPRGRRPRVQRGRRAGEASCARRC